MTVSKAQLKAKARYEERVYDKLLLRLPKGKKDIIKAHAKKTDGSANAFINRAIDETMANDEKGGKK